MSHFVVSVIVSPEKLAEHNTGQLITSLNEAVTAMLAPYHQFECTGYNDEYVQDVDITNDILEMISKGDSYTDSKYDVESALEYYGIERDRYVESLAEIDRENAHKFGYALVRYQDGGAFQIQDNGAGQLIAVDPDNDTRPFELIRAFDRTNPNYKWDWWTIGGRWQGMFENRKGQKCDYLRKGDWPLEEVLERETNRYLRYYDDVNAVLAQYPDVRGFEEIRDEMLAQGSNVDAARKFYWDQPGVTAAMQVKRFDATKEELADRWDEGRVVSRWGNGLSDFLKPRDEYAKKIGWQVVGTYAILDDDGWHEKGKMGWFGMSSDDDESWSIKAMERMRSLPDDHYIVAVDCHI